MERCVRCLYPRSKPDLWFDEDGICSACLNYDKRKNINWDIRKAELERILESGKNDSGYDCVVGSSGGKDSHYIVLKLIELGVRPLVVTATTCHLTRLGRKNIDNLTQYATTIEYSPNKTIRRKLNRLGQLLVGDISWPEHASIFSVPFRAACDFGIPLIFYGECPQEAYGGPVGSDKAKEMTQRWVSEFGGFLGLRSSDFVGHEGITKRDMEDYCPPSLIDMNKVGVRSYFLGQFYEWDSHRNAEIAIENGMECQLPTYGNVWEWENLDNYQTGLHDYGMYLKYGYNRATAQLSVDIRMEITSRSEALRQIFWREPLFPGNYMGLDVKDVLDPIGLSLEELNQSFDDFTNKSLFTALHSV